jgi:acetyltransferase-like isoleucine patch superfamily enzyme
MLRRQAGPRPARFLTLASLRWVLRNRAYTPWYLIRYWRLLRLRLTQPGVICQGMVFLGPRVKVHARTGFGRIVLGRWVHIGEGSALRCHEGTLRIGDKVVFGERDTVNCYLDVEIGAGTIVAENVYVGDFDHVYADIHTPIKDQGIAKSPVRVGPDCWLGTRVSVMRGVTVGRGCVVAAHAVVTRDAPDHSVLAGVPARVLKNRVEEYEKAAVHRAAIADMARKQREAAERLADDPAIDPATDPATDPVADPVTEARTGGRPAATGR